MIFVLNLSRSAGPTLFSIALFPVIVLAYTLLARSEERKVMKEFGDEYRAFRERVPMLLPHWGQGPSLATIRSRNPGER